MKKRTRRILFWLAVIIFGVASYVAILYAQGYKYDSARHIFVRTGAVAVTVNTDADLAVNGKSAGAMSFLSHSAGMNRLLPGTYAIKVTKDGYTSWAKSAVVQEGLLTDFPQVLLLPTASDSQPALVAEVATALKQSVTLADVPTPSPTPSVSPRPRRTPTPTPVPTEITRDGFTLRHNILYQVVDGQENPITDHVLGFALADDGSRVLWWTQTEVWVLWLNSTDYQPYRAAGERELITRFGSPIVRASWFRDHDHIVVDLGADGYRVLETDTRGGLNIIRL